MTQVQILVDMLLPCTGFARCDYWILLMQPSGRLLYVIARYQQTPLFVREGWSIFFLGLPSIEDGFPFKKGLTWVWKGPKTFETTNPENDTIHNLELEQSRQTHTRVARNCLKIGKHNLKLVKHPKTVIRCLKNMKWNISNEIYQCHQNQPSKRLVLAEESNMTQDSTKTWIDSTQDSFWLKIQTWLETRQKLVNQSGNDSTYCKIQKIKYFLMHWI